MTMYADAFIRDYTKKHHSGAYVTQIELLRAKVTRLCGILKSSVIRRLKLDNQILLLLIKKKKVEIIDVTLTGDIQVSKREV